MRRNAAFRGWAVLWAVLQFALPSVATFADARLERESVLAVGSHIEATSSETCRPAHSNECALCQFLSRAVAPNQNASLPEIAVAVHPSAASRIEQHPARDFARVALPRAPPASAA